MSATYPAGIVNLKGETLALSTALASLGIPGIETKQLILYNPSVDFRAHFNPLIKAIWFYDNSQTGTAKWINLLTNGRDLTDRTTTGSGTVLDSMTIYDRLLICFSDIVGGFRVDMKDASVNADADRVMQCTYPVVAVWTALTETDGTIVATAKTFGQDGSVTFTAPTNWASNHFGEFHKYGTHLAIDDVDSTLTVNETLTAVDTGITMSADPSSLIVAGDYIKVESEVMRVVSSSATGSLITVIRGVLGSTAATHASATAVYIYRFDCPDAIDGFWLKINVTGGSLDVDTEIENLWALNKNTDRGYFHAGQEYYISLDRRAVGAFEALLAAGTDTLEINWIRNIS